MTGVFPVLLVCPVTKQHLVPLGKKASKPLYAALAAQMLATLDGQKITAQESDIQFLATENAQHVYSVIDSTPVLIESKQIDLRSIE